MYRQRRVVRPSARETTRRVWEPLVVLGVGFLLVAQTLAPMAAIAATIQTDLFVYQNGDTVTVTGDGFGPTEVVDLVTTDPAATVVDQGTATTDGAGSLTYQFILSATVPGLYDVTATGKTSGLTASTQFDPQDKTSIDLSFTSPGSYGTAVVMSGLLTDDATNLSVPLGGATVSLATYSNSSCSSGQLLVALGTAPTATSGQNAGRYSFGALPPAGSFFVEADYAGDNTHMKSSSSCLPLTIGPATTTTSAAASASSITPVGQTIVSWTASSNRGVTGKTATGTVTLVKDSGLGTLSCSPASVPVSAAQTTGSGFSFTANTSQHFTCSATSLGSYSYHVHFADSDGNYDGSDSASIPLTVVNASTLTVQNASGTYGGTVTNLLATLSSSGSVSGKTISFSLNGTSVGTATTNSSGVATLPTAGLVGISAGTYTTGVSATFAGDSLLAPASATASLTINPRSVTAVVTANSKAYDGGTTATIANCSLSGVLGADSVTCDTSTASANFVDKNVGNGKTVTVTGLKLAGTAATNYVLSSTSSTTTANITAKSLTVNFTTSNKTYDSTTNASIVGCSLGGVVGTEDVSCVSSAAVAQFANKNVGNAKTVTASGFTLSGSAAGNYSIGTINASSANITQRDLAVTATGLNKLYDGNPTATVTLSTNKLAGDTVSASYTSASFANKNVGIGKTVSVSGITISGAEAGNYNLTNTTASTTANITSKGAVINFTAPTRTYDGITATTITGCSVSGAVTGDDVTCDRSVATATFADKNVGVGKTVTGTGFTLAGADAANYSFTVNTATADISRRDLHVTAVVADKTYDATAYATATLNMDKVSGDAVTAAYSSAMFADKNVGNGKTVTVSGITISGADATNYNLVNTTTTTTANITRKDLTVTTTGIDKTYDATTAATVALATDKLSGDDVTPAYTGSAFADKNVGTGKAVSVSGITISGADAGNYNLTNMTAGTIANIAPHALSVAASGVDKVYDGNASAAVTLSTDKIGGDDVTAHYGSASFADKSVANGKAVSVSGITITGTDAGNYHLTNTTAATTADITARDLHVSALGVNKIYDTTTEATVSLSSDKLGADYVVASSASASFADKNVGMGKAVSVTGISIWGADAANYHLVNTTAATTANITRKDLVVSAHGVDKVYDGNATATVTLSSDKLGSDDVSAASTSASFANKNVGSARPVSVTGISISGADAANYNLTNTNAATTANISPKDLTVTASGIDKIYNGNATATVTLATDRLSGDDVTAAYTAASFADKNVGTAKPVSVSGISISGLDAGNYNLTNTTASTTASISPLGVELYFSADDKTYDGANAATILSCSAIGVEGDDLGCDHSGVVASFADKNVGDGKTVTGTGFVLAGADAGNYSAHVNTTLADITPRDLHVTATGVNKEYDTTTAATVTLTDDEVPGDAVTPSYTSAAFADKNVGTGKAVSVSGISITGVDATNYNLANTTAATTANITRKDVTVTATGIDKIYDGNTSATVSLSTDEISGDDVTGHYGDASYADKNVANGKAISVSGITITGVDAHNYHLTNATANATANITPRNLAVTATADNKVYEGNADAIAHLSTDKVAGDDVAADYSGAAFADKNAGDGKTVTVSGIAISGADETNYNLTNSTATTTANITRKDLAVTATGIDKTYDATTAATVDLATDKLPGDYVTPAYTAASFADKNVGTAKAITVSGISISGADATNYNLANTAAATAANITRKDLAVTATGIDKIYDGNTSATVTLSPDKIGGDDVTAHYGSASFADKNVASGKAVSVGGITITGGDAGNYHLTSSTAATTAAVTARDLHVSAHGENKGYDTTTAATVTLADDEVAGDHVTPSYTSAAFADKNVGTGKAVSVSGISISGTDAGNYHLANTTAATSANITARDLHVSALGVNKIYDTTAAATVTLSSDKLGGDYVVASSGSASFADKNVGTGKMVSVSGISTSGTDAGNYHLVNTTTTTTANISQRDLAVTADGVNKVYDGGTLATVTLSTDKLLGDSVTPAYTTASFADKNVANGKAVSVSGITIGGGDAGNYHLTNTTGSATADITARELHVTATGVNREYDTTAAATVTLADDEVAGDHVTPSYTSAAFADKNVGTGKMVSVSGISIWGDDAANYHLVNTTAATTANITRKDLVVSAHGVGKVYDGNATATVTLTSDKLGADDVSAAYTSDSFANKNVGTGRAVSVSGISISGADAVNYNLTNTNAATTANITRKDLTVTASGIGKIYNGNATAAVNLATDGLSGDDVTPAYAAALFADKNVGAGKPVSVSGISISGLDAGNYNLTNMTAITTASISRRDLHVSATGVNRIYDGTTAATVTLSTDNVTGDIVSPSYVSAAFADRNIGIGKTVSVSGITISGSDASNYTLTNSTATTTAIITARPIAVKADDKSKTLGAGDPPLTYAVTSGTLGAGDAWTGAVTRDAGETVGSYGIRQGTLTVSDGNSGNNYAIGFSGGTFQILYAGSGTCAGDAGHVILQPINTDGTSVFKQGSTVPAKFRVCDANGKSIGQSGVVRTFVSTDIAGTATGVNETIVSTTPDTAFRWDSTGQQWIFNISTKNLSPNHTYIYVITLDDGSTITFRFGLK